ncbi:hypothetical protein [Herbaspirillum sp. RV1423]|uniref:hypothetical protein n=1 Tax=Herbaspirillum sp. RV1423 TaxID=1443993 RepID=UPI0004B87E2B|nr:hypothetical protein [Herbaspirillum sp. RV1423]
MSSILQKRSRAALCAAMIIAASAVQAQQGQSMEERLRNQLRITTSQLQEAQNELAVLKEGRTAPAVGAPNAKSAAAPDADSVKKELAEVRAQLASERRTREKNQDASQAALEKANAQVAQYKNAYDELLKLARAAETERQRLAQEEKTQQTAVTQCEAKNAQLYAVGQEILQAYETMDIGTIMSVRQPFAAQSRVKYEQIAQQYGDKLYEGRFDPRSTAAPAAGAPAAASQ